MFAKLFQEFQPIGAAPKQQVVAETRNSHEKRIKTTYQARWLSGMQNRLEVSISFSGPFTLISGERRIPRTAAMVFLPTGGEWMPFQNALKSE
jgi:hypothetical protein